MRISKFSAGLGVILLGAIDAFATTATHHRTVFYYQTGDELNPCTDVTIDTTCQVAW